MSGQWSLYAYVGGNPLTSVDPDGLQEVTTMPGWWSEPMIGNPPVSGTLDPILDIPDTNQPPNNPNSPRCMALARKIQNLRDEVFGKRIPDLEGNPGNLPERIGPGENLRDTVRGHRKLLDRQWRRLNELQDQYARECAASC
jgi:hypothetical protein